MEWKAIIDDIQLKASIEDKIDCIYNALVRTIPKITNIGLYSESMGICLFLFYYHLYKKKKFILPNKLLNNITSVRL